MRLNGNLDIDVAVVGGGPGGVATALTLRGRGYSVAVLERSDYGNVRIGETLPPAIQPLLTRLGVWDEFLEQKHSPSFGIHSAWGQDDLNGNEFILNPYGAGWHIDRRRFDEMLARCAEDAGASVCRRLHLLSCAEDTAGNWLIEIECDNRPRSLRARFVVDATGQTSSFAHKQGARRVVFDRLIGAIGFLSPNSETASTHCFTLVESVEDGWWYSALLPDGRVVAIYMTDGGSLARRSKRLFDFWSSQLRRANHTRERLRNFTLAAPPFLVPANSAVLDRPVGVNWLAVGDAASSFDPLSSQGVSKALKSGIRAAQAIHEGWSGNLSALTNYARWIYEEFDHYLQIRAKYYSQETRWPDAPFWQRRQSVQSDRS